MKKTLLVTVIAIVVALSLPVFAQEFPDVPPDHWAYDAVQELVNAGVIQGYPDGTFGGKRAMTRYEFAEALAKAIPVIAEMVGTGVVTPPTPGITPPAVVGVSPEEVAAIRSLVDEFRNELAALGVDVEALRRDVAALNERVTALEEEVARVRLTGEASLIGTGTLRNSVAAPFDKDSRVLGTIAPNKNLLANSDVLIDLDLGIRAKVSDDTTVTALINTGDYLTSIDGSVDDFTLWHLYADAPVRLGPLGAAQVVAGRFPFQLTPFTLKLVDPDSYTNVTKLDSGDFLVDGARASFNFGRVALTAFGGKTDNQVSDLISPDLLGDVEVSGIAGARAVIGTGVAGNLGLTYYQSALALGRMEVMGADINTNIGSLGLSAEFAQTEPSTAAIAGATTDNTAWNAKLAWQTGKLGLGAGFSTVETNFVAPGYWSNLGRAVNLTNVEGPSVNLTYALSPRLSLAADAQILEPDNNAIAVRGRTTTDQGFVVNAGTGLDKVTGWKAGLKYALTAANSVDLGWEQVTWEPLVGADTEERYISIGLGHSFNANSSLKLLYQIVEYEQGVITPYAAPTTDARGARATAQFQLKF